MVVIPISQSYPFSPRVWGCTELKERYIESKQVFPTRVGMYPFSHFSNFGRMRFPLRVGMYLIPATFEIAATTFSPRVWGCTVLPRCKSVCNRVFPTRVGMYRILYRLSGNS